MRGAKSDLTDWFARDYDAVVAMAADANPGAPQRVADMAPDGT